MLKFKAHAYKKGKKKIQLFSRDKINHINYEKNYKIKQVQLMVNTLIHAEDIIIA